MDYVCAHVSNEYIVLHMHAIDFVINNKKYLENVDRIAIGKQRKTLDFLA